MRLPTDLSRALGMEMGKGENREGKLEALGVRMVCLFVLISVVDQ